LGVETKPNFGLKQFCSRNGDLNIEAASSGIFGGFLDGFDRYRDNIKGYSHQKNWKKRINMDKHG